MIYHHLGSQPGIPDMHCFVVEQRRQLLVMQLLGDNLESIFRARGCRFSTKTICMLAIRMITLVDRVHSKGLVHRDQKPDNYCIGAGTGEDAQKQLYLLDFGLSASYRSVDGRHLPFSQNCGTWGTTRYMSLAAHEGVRQSRRDDLESIGFVLVYFLFNGRLPWSGLNVPSYRRKMRLIRTLKRKFVEEEDASCCPQRIPNAVFDYLHYCRSLRFNERPDYGHRTEYCRVLFRLTLSELGTQDDGIFDWIESTNASQPASTTTASPEVHARRRHRLVAATPVLDTTRESAEARMQDEETPLIK
ncbi:MAG: hypothetical protein MHM6MM_005638 [Cercozoa sp. M6MM]